MRCQKQPIKVSFVSVTRILVVSPWVLLGPWGYTCYKQQGSSVSCVNHKNNTIHILFNDCCLAHIVYKLPASCFMRSKDNSREWVIILVLTLMLQAESPKTFHIFCRFRELAVFGVFSSDTFRGFVYKQREQRLSKFSYFEISCSQASSWIAEF